MPIWSCSHAPTRRPGSRAGSSTVRRVDPMDRWRGQVAVLVPVKAFARAKVRLAPALDAAARAALAEAMASQVLAAATSLPVAVVCDDPGVADWARRHGARVVWEPGRGLNGAVEAGVR